MYDGPSFAAISRCGEDGDYPLHDHLRYKHGSNGWFAQQAAVHPWRVTDPARAELFVVPLLVSFLARHKTCPDGTPLKLLNAAIQAIKRLPYFDAHGGADHLMVSTDFLMLGRPQRRHPLVSRVAALMPGMVWGLQLVGVAQLNASCSFVVPMVSMLPGALSTSTFDEWQARSHPVYFQGQIDTRNGYAPRIAAGRAVAELVESHIDQFGGSMFVATQRHLRGSGRLKRLGTGSDVAEIRLPNGEVVRGTVLGLGPCDCSQKLGRQTVTAGRHCVWCTLTKNMKGYSADMRVAQFALHIRGDLPGSNRLYDVIKAGAIPIIISDRIASVLPFSGAVPWAKMTLRVPEDNVTATHLRTLLNKPNTVYRHTRMLLQRHAVDVLWDVDGTQVTTNVLRSAKVCVSS
jgi:hypothetical protein